MGIFENVFTNALTYVVTLGLGAILKVMLPFLYREAKYNLIYKGPDISGKWKSEFEMNGVKGEEEIEIKQNGNRIKGDISSRIQRDDGMKKILDSQLSGEFRDDFLIAYYFPKEKGKYGCGNFTMKLVEGGDKLEGCCSFQYTKDRSLQIIKNYTWTKS